MGRSRDLEGRTALVTGGARRVGATLSRALARAGAHVLLHHHTSRAAAERLADELGGPPRASVCHADLRDPASIEGLFAALDERGLTADIVVNSASSYQPTSSSAADRAGWDETLALNLRAPYLVTMAALERLGGRAGDIVNIADVWGARPHRGYTAYSVSKAGLLMLTRSLAKELAPRVRVNAIAPGPVLLPDDAGEAERARAVRPTLLGREGSPDDVAAAMMFLLTGTDYATGSVVTVDGGRQIAG